MAKYRNDLPLGNGDLFLLDGGLETTLVFHEGMDLPHFASFPLLEDAKGRAFLRNYYVQYLAIAWAARTGFILDSPTWRANPDWGAKLGYGTDRLIAVNKDAIAMLIALREEHETARLPIVVSGNIGPRGDGYDPAEIMTVAEARDYHAMQVRAFAEAEADMIHVLTMTNVEEATGVALAARDAAMPLALSFTVETDGRLPTGQALDEAIRAVDEATGGSPAYFMINCAHPSHFAALLDTDEAWVKRIRGLRANASRCSHAELDEATELDDGNPAELGEDYRALLRRQPQINVLGGCCGTDHRHVEAICGAIRLAA
ncbi:MAG: homocysteine S-methyltransferase family protein [Proteobacteria bacterium]|nr:homocysteine S-methyltransferase family protein [Pseudomonadota bacterium]